MSHKKNTRRRILKAAGRLFRERGYNGVGVDAVMAEAGLTPGGFYAHFASKEALFTEALTTVMEERSAALLELLEGREGQEWLRTFINAYLSRTHRDMVADGCALPALTPDVVRGSEAARENYQQVLKEFLAFLEPHLPAGDEAARDRALGLVAQCIGGLMLSRAVLDENFSNRILKASRQAARKLSEA